MEEGRGGEGERGREGSGGEGEGEKEEEGMISWKRLRRGEIRSVGREE